MASTRDKHREKEKSDRRITAAGIAVNSVSVVMAAVIGAYATAHSKPIIEVLGGKPLKTVTAAPSVSASVSPSSAPSSRSPSSPSASASAELPAGPAFTRGSFTIGDSGVDLDRNPPEAGNVTTGDVELTSGSLNVSNYNAQDVAKWTGNTVPTQQQCHDDELSNGADEFSADLQPYQDSRTVLRLCVLTSEGRDAYVLIFSDGLTSSSPIPGETFVWPDKIPVN